MTADQLWPDEAREAVARAVATRCGEYTDVPVPSEYYVDADAVLAALSVHAVPRADEWEWGLQREDGRVDGPVSEYLTRRVQSYDGGTIVRRRPAGSWEVAS